MINEYKFNLIKETIKNRHLKIVDIAYSAGYARTYISSILSGKLNYHANLLDNLLKAINIDPKDIQKANNIYIETISLYETCIDYFDLNYGHQVLLTCKKELQRYPDIHPITSHIQELIDFHRLILDNSVNLNMLINKFNESNTRHLSVSSQEYINLFFILLDSSFIYKELLMYYLVEYFLVANQYHEFTSAIAILTKRYLHNINTNGIFLISLLDERYTLRAIRNFNTPPTKDIKDIIDFEVQTNCFYQTRYQTFLCEERLIYRTYDKPDLGYTLDQYLSFYALVFSYFITGKVSNVSNIDDNLSTYYLVNIINGNNESEIIDSIFDNTHLDFLHLFILVNVAIEVYEEKRQYKQANTVLKRLIHKMK